MSTATLDLTTLWDAPVSNGPYKRTDAVITREFIALQTKQRAGDLVKNAPNWFGVPAGVFATLRRPKNGTGKLGKNGWTAELLIEHNGVLTLRSGMTVGDINAIPQTAFVRIVNVRPADTSELIATYQSAGFVRGSQSLPDADRNPVTGSILKPDTAPSNDAPIIPSVDAPAATSDASTDAAPSTVDAQIAHESPGALKPKRKRAKS